MCGIADEAAAAELARAEEWNDLLDILLGLLWLATCTFSFANDRRGAASCDDSDTEVQELS